ncbi:hypothetical protein SCAR479_05186 [Seiridium cardinale]|uniref:Uncharacterized protein n=1 Tax=Seiridium cardinale TaxID=138064 RepID=A0ABR2XWP2_9PEZI
MSDEPHELYLPSLWGQPPEATSGHDETSAIPLQDGHGEGSGRIIHVIQE